MLGGIRYQGMVPLTSGHGVRKDQAVSPLHGGLVGQGRCTAAPGLAAQGGFWGGRSSGEHLQQRALGRAFLLRVSWQLFHASETVSAMGSSSLKVKESQPRARVAAEVAEAWATMAVSSPATPPDEGNSANWGIWDVLQPWRILAEVIQLPDWRGRLEAAKRHAMSKHFTWAFTSPCQSTSHGLSSRAGGVKTTLLDTSHYLQEWKAGAKSCQMQQSKYILGIHGAAPTRDQACAFPYGTPKGNHEDCFDFSVGWISL